VILKQSNPQQLIQAIRRVAAGETWWDTGVLRSLGKIGPDTVGTVKALTERQQTVLRGILDGLTNKEIATQIGTSETSVKATIQELFSKAGVRTRSQLVRFAIERYSAEWLAYQQPSRPQFG
jgi:DNA-binding NarL/FixJ family response regulator